VPCHGVTRRAAEPPEKPVLPGGQNATPITRGAQPVFIKTHEAPRYVLIALVSA
jgi:hypothetical protein